MGPGVDTDFMPGHVLFEQNLRPFNDTRANNKEGSIDILCFKEVEEVSDGKD